MMTLKPYKMDGRYFVADFSNTYSRSQQKLDGVAEWEAVRILEWFEEAGKAEEIDIDFFSKAAQEITWLEVLIITGRSRRDSEQVYGDSFSDPGRYF